MLLTVFETVIPVQIRCKFTLKKEVTLFYFTSKKSQGSIVQIGSELIATFTKMLSPLVTSKSLFEFIFLVIHLVWKTKKSLGFL